VRRGQPEREADAICAPTCPAVDAAFDALLYQIDDSLDSGIPAHVRDYVVACCEQVKKVGTLLLRDALISQCSERIELEEKVNDLEGEVNDLRGRVDDLKYEIASLEKELP
jgi:hypothetical protein